MLYQELIEKDLAEIKAEYESAKDALIKPEYVALIEACHAMLDASNEDFFAYVKNLTKLEHEMMVKRMSKTFLRQYNKPNTNKILILALQMKQDFANIKDDFLTLRTRLLKS